MKKISVILAGVFIIYLMTVVFANSVMDDLSENIIRLHIVANSNSEKDQEVKLKIRDEILRADINITDKETAIKNLRKAEKIASDILAENGFSYGAKADFGFMHFPQKSYDGITLPEGDYNGLNIVLGKGEGKNWWCILAPMSSMAEGTVSFDDSPISSRLNKKTVSLVSGDYKYKSKILEFFGKLF